MAHLEAMGQALHLKQTLYYSKPFQATTGNGTRRKHPNPGYKRLLLTDYGQSGHSAVKAHVILNTHSERRKRGCDVCRGCQKSGGEGGDDEGDEEGGGDEAGCLPGHTHQEHVLCGQVRARVVQQH